MSQAFLGGERSPKDSNGLKGIAVFAFKVRILFDFLSSWWLIMNIKNPNWSMDNQIKMIRVTDHLLCCFIFLEWWVPRQDKINYPGVEQ